jgi:hypothetical protein
MEDVLEVYAEPDDPERPMVGFDERPLQRAGETPHHNPRGGAPASD